MSFFHNNEYKAGYFPYYINILHKNGDIEKARTYLQMAIDKQEPEALNSPLRKLLQ